MTSLVARSHALRTGRLEVIDAPRAELDREWDAAGLRELVGVQPKLETSVTARLEIAPGLVDVESAPLEEDVGGVRDCRCFRQHDLERESHVGIGIRELGRNSMRPSQVGTPPESRIAESMASSVSRSSP